MKTKRMLFLIGAAALSLTATLASAAPHASQMMTRSAVTRPAPRFAPRTMTGARRFRNDGDNDRDDRFRRFHNRTFVYGNGGSDRHDQDRKSTRLNSSHVKISY